MPSHESRPASVPATRWATATPPLAVEAPSRRRARTVARPTRPTLLEQFTTAMQAQGQPVLASRMRGNRHYAMRCLAEAHAHGDQMLRELATRLFEVYQGEPLSG